MSGLVIAKSSPESSGVPEKLQKVLSSIANGEAVHSVDLSNCGLKEIPQEIFRLKESLEVLNLGGNELTHLPEEMGELKKLRVLFFAQNHFTDVPVVLGTLPSLYMLSFKSNRVERVDASSLSPSVGWLILTDNRISELPSSIGRLTKLRKLMLAGNRLSRLPDEMQSCRELELIRLAANEFQLSSLPAWLWRLPKLTWLAIAGNDIEGPSHLSNKDVSIVDWRELDIKNKLGEGASGLIYRASWAKKRPNTDVDAANDDVAVKLFKGGKTSDGLPEDEMKAAESAGDHPCSFPVLGRVTNAPDGQQALIFPLIPPEYSILGNPPSFETVTRDTFPKDTVFPLQKILTILRGISSVCAHLHRRGISHGDLYAHNILVTAEGSPILSDFGAASFYPRYSSLGADTCANTPGLAEMSTAMERFEVRAFGCLIEDLISRVDSSGSSNPDVMRELANICSECMSEDVTSRPTFEDLQSRVGKLSL